MLPANLLVRSISSLPRAIHGLLPAPEWTALGNPVHEPSLVFSNGRICRYRELHHRRRGYFGAGKAADGWNQAGLQKRERCRSDAGQITVEIDQGRSFAA